MRKRYFFFDYDGTLAIKKVCVIPDSTKEALRKLEEAGHFVALATGRLQANALDYVSSAGITNLVADGGYSVTLDGELVWMQPLELEPVKDCLRKLDELGVPWSVSIGNELRRWTNNPEYVRIAQDYYLPTVLDENLTIDGLEQVYKAYIYCPVPDEPSLLATGVLDNVPWVRYAPDALFVEPMCKEFGIRKMMDILGASYEDAVVFGDGLNDVSMFDHEWTCIAMGNAREVLKAKADYITTDVDKDGIWNACKHFGWIE